MDQPVRSPNTWIGDQAAPSGSEHAIGDAARRGARVAIKVMSPALVLMGPDMIERFKREARTAAALSHPHIIPIHAVRQSGQLLFFVMKFVPGRTLDSIIRELGQLPVPMIQAILSEVGGALAYAHRQGVVHRDVKPANIIGG